VQALNKSLSKESITLQYIMITDIFLSLRRAAINGQATRGIYKGGVEGAAGAQSNYVKDHKY
jgi:hypothetical protein